MRNTLADWAGLRLQQSKILQQRWNRWNLLHRRWSWNTVLRLCRWSWALFFFLLSYGKEMGIYKGRMLGLYDYILVMSALNSLLTNILSWSIFSYHECVWTVAPGPKENRYLGSAISNQYQAVAILQRNTRFEGSRSRKFAGSPLVLPKWESHTRDIEDTLRHYDLIISCAALIWTTWPSISIFVHQVPLLWQLWGLSATT